MMNEQKKSETLSKLSELLEAEKVALMSGDFEKIETAYETKKQLLEAVMEGGDIDDVPELNSVRNKIKRNQELFDHALSGIKAVAARINEAHKAAKGVDTYDAKGNKMRIETKARGSLEKRA